MPFPLRRLYTVPLPGGGALHLGERTLVMGILNVTPDSFAESCSYLDPQVAVARAFALQAAGADIIDIGGESTRPGADAVGAEEELRRVLPVVAALRDRVSVPLSIDTYKAEVAAATLEAGASIINDISGLQYDPPLAGVVARHKAALVLMHTRGRSKAMYAHAEYDDAVTAVARELRQRLDAAISAGVLNDQIVVDPGIGFAKRSTDSYGVLARLSELAQTLDRPVLVGPSRKSFLQEATGSRPAAERDWGTAAAVAAAVLSGAHIVRVHAVEEMAQVVNVAEAIRKHGRIAGW